MMRKSRYLLVVLSAFLVLAICSIPFRMASGQKATGDNLALEVEEELAIEDAIENILQEPVEETVEKATPAPAKEEAKDAVIPAPPVAPTPEPVVDAAAEAKDLPAVDSKKDDLDLDKLAEGLLADEKPEAPTTKPPAAVIPEPVAEPAAEPAAPVAPAAPAVVVVEEAEKTTTDDGIEDVDKAMEDIFNDATVEAENVVEKKPVPVAAAGEQEAKKTPEKAPAAVPVVEATPAAEVAPLVEAEPVPTPDVVEKNEVVPEVAPAQAAAVEPAVPVVEEVPVPLIEEPKVMDPRSAEISLMKDSEQLRRRAYERHGRESLEGGDKMFLTQKYHEATRLYTEAFNAFKEAGFRAENETDRLKAQNGLRESIYMEAIDLRQQGDFENAQKRARTALIQGHPLAAALLAEIKKDIDGRPEPEPEPPDQRWKEDDYKKQQKAIAEHLVRAREFYLAGELDKAQKVLEQIMKMDPYNTEAIRMMEKTARTKGDAGTLELDYTRRYMIGDVRRAWNRRDYSVDEVPGAEPTKGDPKTKLVNTKEKEILDKMSKIEIPEIDFRQANIHDVVTFLQSASVEYDDNDGAIAGAAQGGDRKEKKGVNIILNLGNTGAGAAPDPGLPAAGGADPDPFAPDPGAGGNAGPGATAGDVPLITFSARYISLLEALRLVTQIADLKYRVEGSVVMIVPSDAPDGDIIHRSYDVMTAFTEKTKTISDELATTRGMGGGGAIIGMGPGGVDRQGMDLKRLFGEMGVKWPNGSFIKHVPSVSKIMVANTANNLTIFEEKLALLNVVPNQIEIEARFVEVRQTDLMSLGVELGLTDAWELAHRTDIANTPISGRPHIVAESSASAGGFTRGNRFLRNASSDIATPDDLLRIAGVLTNPELTLVLHALQQKGNADLLSAPKVTTQSGEEATIKVVTEYIYPTEFDVEPITAGDGDTARIVGGIVEPSSFETREVGVILSVIPTVSPEGLISLVMAPEVVSEPVWHNYGSVYVDSDGNEQRLNMEQPFFHTRTVNTQIAIYNNATVVMGGMINEIRTEVDDKIPFLGDIPLFGRLFRSRYDHSEKRNLLIFVTARLVDPAGRPILRRKKFILQEEKPE